MSDRRNLCVLVAEVTGHDQLAGRLGSTEAAHAAERCTNRIDRAVEGNGGVVLQRDNRSVVVSFERCDSAVLASCEMQERVASLPPVSGTHLNVRIGLHYGALDAAGEGEALDTARQLSRLARGGQALASGSTVMLLSPVSRHYAGTEAMHGPEIDKLDWPVYAIGQRIGTVTSVPPASRVTQRLRLRHQQDILFVEEQRPVLLLGRELGNDVVIIDARASRQHARIERRHEGFVLTDQSTNGTFVSIDGIGEVCVKDGEIALSGPGRIGCGFSANEIERDLVFFDIV